MQYLVGQQLNMVTKICSRSFTNTILLLGDYTSKDDAALIVPVCTRKVYQKLKWTKILRVVFQKLGIVELNFWQELNCCTVKVQLIYFKDFKTFRYRTRLNGLDSRSYANRALYPEHIAYDNHNIQLWCHAEMDGATWLYFWRENSHV